LKSLAVSFCCLTELPKDFCMLKSLQFLDVSYNNLTELPRNIQNIVSLSIINLEGNELVGLPCTMMEMVNMKRVRITRNFMSPAFYPESRIPPRLPSLLEICLTRLQRSRVEVEDKEVKVLRQLSIHTPCDCCGKPMYGDGIRLLRHKETIWGLRLVPFVFRVCSMSCHRSFKLGN